MKAKTRWIFAILLVGMVVVSAVTINRLTSVVNESSVMSTVWVPRSRAVEDLSDAASAYRISEALRILSVTPEMARHADRDLADNAEEFKTKLAEYRRRLRPHESAAPVDNVEALWAGYVANNVQMLAFANEQKTEEAADRYRNSASKFYLLSDALIGLSEYNAKESALATARSQKMGRQAKYIIFGALILVFLRLVTASVFFESKVWRVLVGQSAVMQKLAQGDFTAEVEGASR